MSKVYTEIVYQMTETIGEYILVSETSYEYEGEIALAKGASSDQTADADQMKALGQAQLAFFNQVASSYAQVFQNSKAIMSSLKAVMQPVIDKGMTQYGFSLPEDSVFRSQATTVVGQQYKNAAQAAGERIASTNGGNVALPSGAEAAARRNIATQAAQTEAGIQTGITEKGFAQGRQNFLEASRIMAAAPGELFDPATKAGALPIDATRAASDTFNNAFNADTKIAAENAAADPGAAIGGVLGGAAGAYLGGPAGKAAGQSIGSALGGAA